MESKRASPGISSVAFRTFRRNRKMTGFSHEDAYARNGNTVKVIAIYNKPDDFPGGYIARLFNGIVGVMK